MQQTLKQDFDLRLCVLADSQGQANGLRVTSVNVPATHPSAPLPAVWMPRAFWLTCMCTESQGHSSPTFLVCSPTKLLRNLLMLCLPEISRREGEVSPCFHPYSLAQPGNRSNVHRTSTLGKTFFLFWSLNFPLPTHPVSPPSLTWMQKRTYVHFKFTHVEFATKNDGMRS